MRITIVGAGPVGLLAACLLSQRYTITILEKRTEPTRNHALNISFDTISAITSFLSNNDNPAIRELCDLMTNWSNTPVSTNEIETSLSNIAEKLGVTIRRGVKINSLESIDDSIVIGADGAHSKIRELVFNNEVCDEYNAEYMAQVKFETPGATRPRLTLSAISYSFLNGLSGSDMVIDFESLASPNDSFLKNGTLHIPIPQSVYNILSDNNRGNYVNPWTVDELSLINNSQVAKLVRIIKRYNFSLRWRGGYLGDAKITVIPLTIYRSCDVVKFTITNKLVILMGDSSSGLVFQRGLNKSWLEALKCAQILLNPDLNTLPEGLGEYASYCISLYESEKNQVISKHNKIMSANRSTSTAGIVLTSGLGVLLTKMLSR